MKWRRRGTERRGRRTERHARRRGVERSRVKGAVEKQIVVCVCVRVCVCVCVCVGSEEGERESDLTVFFFPSLSLSLSFLSLFPLIFLQSDLCRRMVLRTSCSPSLSLPLLLLSAALPLQRLGLAVSLLILLFLSFSSPLTLYAMLLRPRTPHTLCSSVSLCLLHFDHLLSKVEAKCPVVSRAFNSSGQDRGGAYTCKAKLKCVCVCVCCV